MELGKIYKNFLVAAVSRAITALIGLVIIGFLTRHLGQAGYGAYETILSYLFIFTILADFGLHIIHVREISRHPEKETFISGNIFTLRLVLVVLVMVLAATAGSLLPYTPEIKNGILIAALFVVFSSLSQVLAGIFQKYHTFYQVSLADILTRAAQLGLVFWGVKNNFELLFFISTLSLTAALQFLIIFFLSRSFIKFSLKLDLPYLKSILKVSLPVAFSILFTAIYIRTDALMLSLMKTPAEVGIYRLPAKLLETLVFFPALLVELTIPTFSYLAFNLKEIFNKLYKKTFNILLIFAVPVVVFLFVLAEKVILILGGKDFILSALPLKILAFVAGLVFLNNLGGKALIVLDLQKAGMRIYLFGAILNIVLNFIFIPKYSYLGAAWTTLGTEILVTILMFLILFKKAGRTVDFKILAKSLIAGLVTGLVIYQFKELNILIPLSMGLIIYFPFLYLIKGFTKSDLKEIFNTQGV